MKIATFWVSSAEGFYPKFELDSQRLYTDREWGIQQTQWASVKSRLQPYCLTFENVMFHLYVVIESLINK
jgi:hypothetical protein